MYIHVYSTCIYIDKNIYTNLNICKYIYVNASSRVCCLHQGSGSRVQGSGFKVQGSGFRIQIAGSRVQSAGFRDRDSGLGVQSSKLRLQGADCRVQGAGCRVQGAGCWVQGGAKLAVLGWHGRERLGHGLLPAAPAVCSERVFR